MKIFRIILLSFIVNFLICCKRSDKDTILLADREAPLGWIYLKMYNDNTFEFISKGFIFDDVYPGTYELSHDTIYFEYSEKIPEAGKIALIHKNFVKYIAGTYPENVIIKRNIISQHSTKN